MHPKNKLTQKTINIKSIYLLKVYSTAHNAILSLQYRNVLLETSTKHVVYTIIKITISTFYNDIKSRSIIHKILREFTNKTN